MRPCLPLGAGRVSQCVEWRVRDSGIADLHSGDQGTVVKGVGAAAAVRDAEVGGQGSGFRVSWEKGGRGSKSTLHVSPPRFLVRTLWLVDGHLAMSLRGLCAGVERAQ